MWRSCGGAYIPHSRTRVPQPKHYFLACIEDVFTKGGSHAGIIRSYVLNVKPTNSKHRIPSISSYDGADYFKTCRRKRNIVESCRCARRRSENSWRDISSQGSTGQDAGVDSANTRLRSLPRPKQDNGSEKSPFERWLLQS